MCQEYHDDLETSFIYSQAISGFIVGVNTALKEIIISLVQWIGEPNHSSQIYLITVGVFVATFLNTGVIILLINASFFSDYSHDWYRHVGSKIVNTMILNAFMPIAMTFSSFA